MRGGTLSSLLWTGLAGDTDSENEGRVIHAHDKLRYSNLNAIVQKVELWYDARSSAIACR